MTDYESVLQKLVGGLPDRDAANRHAVYDRARTALGDQLKNLQPPLAQAEIDREARLLEEAIGRVEAAQAQAEPAPPAVPPAARLQRSDTTRKSAPPRTGRTRPPVGGDLEGSGVVAIRRGGRPGRSRALLLALVLLAAPVAVLAWLWRDSAAPPSVVAPAPVQEEVGASGPAPDLKYGERVAGDRSSGTQTPPAPVPVPERPPVPAPEPPRPAAQAPVPTPDISIAQRALIFEENQADPQKPGISLGRATWRLDTMNGGPGQPLETVIRGQLELPEAGLGLALLLRRNLDAALPASHTIELTFTSLRPGSPGRAVRDVALPMMRPEEGVRGVAIVGLPVPVKDNVFLIGLSDLRADIDRNLELLLRRNWIELPIRFASGQKAALLFDKGYSGERIFLDAFRQWGQAPPEPARP